MQRASVCEAGGFIASHLVCRLKQEGHLGLSVAQVVHTVTEVAGKTIHIRYVEGPVGVQSRNFSNERI